MNSYNDILDYFPSEEMKRKIEGIVYVIDDLSHKTPVTGFHYSFYVPGWIGMIQMSAVEGRMRRFAEKPFYKGMNYYEFANWIIEQSKEVASLHNETASGSNETVILQNEAIIRVFMVMTTLWINYSPEISRHCNIYYSKDILISPAGLVYKCLEENLKELGYTNAAQTQDSDHGIKDSVKDFLYRILGFIINIVILALIFGLLGAIFG